MTSETTMYAYVDTRNAWGYSRLCATCLPSAHIDTSTPLDQPPALGETQPCDGCGKHFLLVAPEKG